MTPFVVVLGIIGAVLILVGLVGGGFTFSGSFMPGVSMPKVGNWLRLPCFSMGIVLVLAAIVLGFSNNPLNPPPPPRVVATGTIKAPQGYSTIYVRQQPSQSSSSVAEVASGATIGILCTAQGDVVTNPDTGQSSSLWDGTSEGYIPDVFVNTGTNQATMGSCR